MNRGTLLLALLPVLALVHSAHSKVPVGMNLEGRAYYTAGMAFVDRFKDAQPFISQNTTSWSDPRPLQKDADGYVTKLLPQQMAGSLMVRNLDDRLNASVQHYPEGIYVFQYTGNCSGCTFLFASTIIERNETSRRWLVNCTGSGGIYFRIYALPDDPTQIPRNFTLVPLANELTFRTQPFDADYLKLLSSGFSVLRFMDWLATNNSPNQNWADRVLPSNYTQASDLGVAWEYIALLANTTGINPWINVPHLATDDYVQQLAEFLYRNVDPKLQIHVEYSNECWNTMFACTAYAQTMGEQEGLPKPEGLHWYGNRVCQVASIFRQVFGSSAASRLYMVMGTQFVNPWVTQQVLWNNNSQCVQAVAVGAYFGLGKNSTGGDIPPPQILNMTMDDLFAALERGRTDYRGSIAGQYNVTRSMKLDLVAYEGGSGLSPPGFGQYHPYQQNVSLVFDAMARDPRMRQQVTEHLQDWEAEGGNLHNLFSFQGWEYEYGDWGHLEWYDSLTYKVDGQPIGAYKWLGAMDYVQG